MYNNKILQKTIDLIAVSERKYEDAVNRYKSITEWLKRPESTILKYSPYVYIHGSFSIGTAINPIKGTEYDMDVMVSIEGCNTSNISQYNLKKIVGEELKLYAINHGMEDPEDRKRAWTINYSEKSQFKIDLLPSVPCNKQETDYSVYLTQKGTDLYNQIHTPWELKSNPKGYLKWFKERCRENIDEKIRNYADSKKITIEKVPKYAVLSTLQEVVMLLKRHRDVFFEKLEDETIKDKKVSSIIITTLAAQVYKKEKNISDAFINIVENFEDAIKVKNINLYENFKYDESFTIGNKDFQILNPSYPAENFTDKWRLDPYLKIAFFKWLSQLKNDTRNLKKLLSGNNLSLSILYSMFGESTRLGLEDFLVKDVAENEQFYLKQHGKYEKLIGEVTISGYHSDKDISELKDYELWRYKFNSNEPINKNEKLLFIANVKNISEPYEIWWQVLNKEKEAIKADSIRGEFTVEGKYIKNNIARYQRKEETSYSGTHWVRCFLIKNNTCYAKSTKFYVKVN